MPRPMVDITGQRFGRLVVESQAPDTFSPSGQRKRNWNAVCDCGSIHRVSGTALTQGHSRSCGCLLRETNVALKTKAFPCYEAFHTRLRRQLGSAAMQACVDCNDKAEEWSYNHLDPNEALVESRSGRKLVRYSASAEYYEPRCKSCHRKFDRRYA